jgi:hypothetical protein
MRLVLLALLSLLVVTSVIAHTNSTSVPGDLNNDGVVNVLDLEIVTSLSELVLVGKYFGMIASHESFTKTVLVYYGGGASLTSNDVPWLAKYDLISIDRFRHHNIDGATWSAIKHVNPDIEIYLYQDSRVKNDNDHHTDYYLNNIARYDSARGHSMGSLNTNNSELFTIDAAGNRVYTMYYSDPSIGRFSFSMDYSNNRFSDYWLEATINDIVDQSWVADGVFGDNLAPMIHSGLSGVPVQMPTDELWTQAMEGHVQRITHGLHQRGQNFWANRGNTRYQEGFDSWLTLDTSPHPPDVLMEEGAFVVKWGSGDAQFYPEQDWKRQVDILNLINNSRVTMLSHTTLTEGSSGIDQYGEPIEYYQLLWYALTSYYLGMKENSYFSFHGYEGYSRNWWYEEYGYIDLGASVDSYQSITIGNNNIYYREFEEGFVYVNPGREEVSDIPLPEPLRMLNHDNFKRPELVTLITTMTLPRFTGTVLVR